ncbi:MAG: MFS transporter [Bryobacteraceae bacterium]
MESSAALDSRLIRRTHPALILLAAFCGSFVGFGSVVIFTFGIFLKPLTAEFGWSRSQVSLAFTLTALTVAFCSPFIGRLLDRFPARKVILPCVVLYGLCFASLGLLTAHYWQLLLVFVCMGIVGNGTTQLGYARVISSWFERNRGRALAVVMAGSGMGSVVFPPFAQWLIMNFGWRVAYLILGAVILVLGLPLTAAFVHEPHERKQPDAVVQVRSGSLRASLLSSTFLCLLSGLMLFSLATNGLTAHLVPYLTDRGSSAAGAANVMAAMGFATLASKLLTGYLLDRFRASRTAALLFAVCACGMLLIIFDAAIWSSYTGALLVGVGLGAESDAVPYLLTRYFGLERFSELYGYTWSAYAVAGALGPLVLGRFFDVTHSYRLVLLIFTAAVACAAMLFAKLPSYRKLDQPKVVV